MGLSSLDISEIYPCIQGEGILAGTPMLLVRLHGCSLRCSFCDTRYAWGGFAPLTLTPNQVMRVAIDYPELTWVLVTGGEPCEQDLTLLADLLTLTGKKVALETSGSSPLSGEFSHVCVSPKQVKPPLQSVISQADEIKFVIGSQADLDWADQLLSSLTIPPDCTLLLQPMSQDTYATRLCVDTCKARGWRLSLQIHKYLGEP
jgi:7-carboxy-7-deazaguanine synthase